MAEVKVLGVWYSPYVKRVEMGLKLKGVEYEYVEDDLKNKSPLLLEYNPVHKKVPVLVHDGKPISESLVILEYIDEVWAGPSILPDDPLERAQARFWAKFIEEKCTATTWRACFKTGEEGEKAKKDATEALQFLEDELNGKKFFGVDNIGLVDITASFLAGWLPAVQEIMGLQLISEDKFPNLAQWAHEYSNNSLVKEVLPQKEKLIAHFGPLKPGSQ